MVGETRKKSDRDRGKAQGPKGEKNGHIHPVDVSIYLSYQDRLVGLLLYSVRTMPPQLMTM